MISSDGKWYDEKHIGLALLNIYKARDKEYKAVLEVTRHFDALKGILGIKGDVPNEFIEKAAERVLFELKIDELEKELNQTHKEGL